jgi:hypothetical protein
MNRALLILVLCVWSCGAADYYVTTTGHDDTGDGSSANPWRTIQHAADSILAGDTVHVAAGTYDERVTVTTGGTSGSGVTFSGTSAICRGFALATKHHVTIRGFEIDHGGGEAWPYAGVTLDNSTNVIVELCNIHDTYGVGVRTATGKWAGNFIARSNTVTAAGAQTNTTTATLAFSIVGTNVLIEQNVINRYSDGFYVEGQNFLVRSNRLTGVDADEWDPDPHPDCIEAYTVPTVTVFFDGNVIETNLMANSHTTWFNGQSAANMAGFRHFVFRRNVAYQVGSYAFTTTYCPYSLCYNNTFIECGTTTHQSPLVDVSYGTNSWSINNVFYNCNDDTSQLYYGPGAPAGWTNNWDCYYLSGSIGITESNGIASDPLLSGYSLTESSPARNAAGPQAVTVGSGTSTTITLDTSRPFHAGFGLTAGDPVTVGSTDRTITAVDYDAATITVDTAITWSAGTGVWLSGTKDIGAYEFVESEPAPPTPITRAVARGKSAIRGRVTIR